jgi:four helix bundle protein
MIFLLYTNVYDKVFVNYFFIDEFMNQYFDSFRKLIVWREAKKLTLEIYRVTAEFPLHERYGIVSQLRRAATSVMANIAEGNERKTKKDRLHFFSMSKSSLSETDCFLELSYDLQYINPTHYSLTLSQLNKTAYLLLKLISSVR